ncbi:hypothetical protein [Streptomyces sp. YPW6]|uniref:hypothetical protein n=1 Tax=Streptomyces sp. YPW6 TaxID=2840373 RepID=UPI003D761695
MRDLIALLTHWLRALLGHTRPGRHSAAYLSPTPPRPTSRPSHAEQIALVRPYLIAHERDRERRLQRERRTAATLATLGIDYDVTEVVAV